MYSDAQPVSLQPSQCGAHIAWVSMAGQVVVRSLMHFVVQAVVMQWFEARCSGVLLVDPERDRQNPDGPLTVNA